MRSLTLRLIMDAEAAVAQAEQLAAYQTSDLHLRKAEVYAKLALAAATSEKSQ